MTPRWSLWLINIPMNVTCPCHCFNYSHLFSNCLYLLVFVNAIVFVFWYSFTAWCLLILFSHNLYLNNSAFTSDSISVTWHHYRFFNYNTCEYWVIYMFHILKSVWRELDSPSLQCFIFIIDLYDAVDTSQLKISHLCIII